MEFIVIPWLCLIAVTMAHPFLVSLAWAIPFMVTCELSYQQKISHWWACGIAIAALVYALLFITGYVLLSGAMKGLH